MEYFEESSDNKLCDKGISYIHSCRECIFNVLCRLERMRERNLFNNSDKDDNRPD